MTSFRWWLFKRLSAFGWRVCPEPHRSRLQSVMPSWDVFDKASNQMSDAEINATLEGFVKSR